MLKFSLSLRNNPRCFWKEEFWSGILLNLSTGFDPFTIFVEMMSSCTGLGASELKKAFSV